MKENRLYVVRHGETEWSRDGKHTGSHSDIPLTEEGREVATRLGSLLPHEHFALVLTSPLGRARDTAAIAGHPEAEVDADLVEWDYGEMEGRTTDEIRETRPGWFLWDDGVVGGETIDEVAARAQRVIARVRDADGDVLAFAHGHFLRILAARWLDQAPRFGSQLVLGPATLSVLGWERHQPAIERWNSPCP